ncbi:MAG: YdcF family protein [Verrucomicrobia bacterium]|nr:YdcF family protein [Leptolyngbya sp. ES-bin-22]
MVLLLTDVFLLLTQVLLWIVIGLVTWFILLKALPKAFLGMLVLLLILLMLGVGFTIEPVGFNSSDIFRTLWNLISLPFRPLSLGVILLLILLTGAKVNKVVGNIIRIGLVLLLACCLPIVSYFLAQELEWEGIRMIQSAPTQVTGSTPIIALLGDGTTRAFLGPRTTCPPTRPTAGAPAQPTTPRPPDGEEPVSVEAYRVMTQPPTQLPIQLADKADRLLYAAQLYRQNPGSLIVISAPQRLDRKLKEGETKEIASEAKDIETFLNQSLGVPCGAMRLDHDGVSIRRSAENIKKLLDDNRIAYGNQLTVVNTAMSTERTFRTFREVFGFCPIARPTDFYTVPSRSKLDNLAPERDLVEHNLQATDFLPSVDALYLGSQAIEEYSSSLYYFLRGWIKFRDLRECGEIAERTRIGEFNPGQTPAVTDPQNPRAQIPESPQSTPPNAGQLLGTSTSTPTTNPSQPLPYDPNAQPGTW